MEAVKKTQRKFTSMALGAAVLLALIFLLLGQKAICRGVLLGTIFSVLNFLLMGLALPYRLGPSRSRSTFVSLGSIVVRYAILAIPVILAVNNEPYDLVATIVGIFMVQLMILLDQLLIRFTVSRTKP